MSQWIGLTVVAAALATMALGCGQHPAATAAVVEDKTYTVTPTSVTVKAGVIAGEVIGMKVTERVEQVSGRVVSPAKLTGTLKLKNASASQTVRLVTGRLQYLDGQGQPIKLEDTRTEPTLRFITHGGDRLDPGQEATQSLSVNFPAAALKAQKLKEIRLELVYVPSPHTEETVDFIVSIGPANQPKTGFPLGSPPIQTETFDRAFTP
jgi:hypothetical protein